MRERALKTERPRWRVITSALVWLTMCMGMCGSFWYLYAFLPAMRCHTGFLYLSIVWLFAELLVIYYLFRYSNIPRYARDSIGVLMACSNIWFGLFIFSLKTCG